MIETQSNIDTKVVEDFGREWSSFDQTTVSHAELREVFDNYFDIFPWDEVTNKAIGFDLGCGSGRWAQFVAPRVSQLHCIDPSDKALHIAIGMLKDHGNCQFHLAGVGNLPIADDSMDFGYSLGVLHHVPDTMSAIRNCVRKLKPKAPFLLYLYYAFDNRPFWFRLLWKVSEVLRRLLSRAPYAIKYSVTQMIAVFVYYPIARLSRVLEKIGVNVESIPLSFYRNKSFYTMRTDALDRFGTRLEQRFTKEQIEEMMRAAGLVDIRFSDRPPYWCAVGYRKFSSEVPAVN